MESMKSVPQQLYKPADACRIAEVAPYVLRYWETEFPMLSEGKEKGAPRAYTERDVRIIARIRELLYDEGFTVAGAKKRLEAEIGEGRFDDELKAAPTAAQQRESRKTGSAPAEAAKSSSAVAVSEAPEPAFLAEPAGAKATASRSAAPSSDFADRSRVIKELKEIVRILDRGRKK